MQKWLKTAVFYEIYPQSFNDTNGDGIGDLQGIIEKLDYIKELGCNAIWINPCFESPFHDAGYDISDYYKIAPRYGTNEDARRLFTEVHKRDMHILLDLVPGHTSIEHKWFKESMKSSVKKPNEYHHRYIWTESAWESSTEGVTNVRGELSGFCERGNCAANFFTTQPALNYGFFKTDPKKTWQISMNHPGARATKEAMWDIMKFWLSMGCDGFRVDMASSLIKNDDENATGIITFWQEIRKRLDKDFPEAAIVSEWGEPDKSLRAGFDMDFLLHFGPSHYLDLFRENPYFAGNGDLTDFWTYYADIRKKAGEHGLICIPSGNHDMDRISYHLDTEQTKLAFVFLLTMPGAPFIYYGDEIGMRYIDTQESVEGGYGRTGSRTPMQWDKTLNAGFSSAPESELYIPLDTKKSRPDVETQMKNKKSLWHFVKELIEMRLSNPDLQNTASFELISKGAKGEALCYKRGNTLVAINPLDKDVKLNINGSPLELKAKSWLVK